MAFTLKTTIQFPIFSPPPPHHHHHHRPATVIRFSRWNNANAQKFIRHERTQKELEDEHRFQKRFESAGRIADLRPTNTTPPPFKSTGTPSTPSRSSIPGKKSKYSKPHQNPNPSSHPAFKRIVRIRKLPTENEDETGIKVGDNGLSYVIPEAPFEFQYSYTETPKVKPIKLREPPIAPFGPGTMPRPWTGKKPLPPSKKKIDFDSFTLPPPHKKGVKPVQAPGPFLPGSGPKYVQSREEILGEPLSKEEIDALIKGCLKSQRQLNMGRDGLTHNMLDNIHAHWKRRRVCKIKCKGVCTVDMDNVRQQLEEKTGGKIIYSKGGVVYLFRGRNYNYKTRPVYPLMLWKPITPVYPRLIQRVPEGLTMEEARDMRMKGRQLIPICKLGKNGVYCDLAHNVREAFEACDLVRINCEGMNASDYRRIGAKLKDLVPCVLISFEHEHILVWRGQNWKSMFARENAPQGADSVVPSLRLSPEAVTKGDSNQNEPPSSTIDDTDNYKTATLDDSDDGISESEDDVSENVRLSGSDEDDVRESVTLDGSEDDVSENMALDDGSESVTADGEHEKESPSHVLEKTKDGDCLEGVALLLKQAVEGGLAVVLDGPLDADVVYAKAVAFGQSAPPGLVFRHPRPKKAATETEEKQEAEETNGKEAVRGSERKQSEKTSSRTRKKDSKENYLDVVPRGTLRVDELAKLLG